MDFLHPILAIQDGKDPLQCRMKHCFLVRREVLTHVGVQKIKVFIRSRHHIFYFNLG